MNNGRVYKVLFLNIYPSLVAKAERKGRTWEEVKGKCPIFKKSLTYEG